MIDIHFFFPYGNSLGRDKFVLGFFFIVLGISFNPGRFLLDLCIYFDAGHIHRVLGIFYSICAFIVDAGRTYRVLGVFYSIYAFLFYAGCMYSALGRFKLYWALFVAGRHLQRGFSFLGVFAFLSTLWVIIEGNCVHSRLYIYYVNFCKPRVCVSFQSQGGV